MLWNVFKLLVFKIASYYVEVADESNIRYQVLQRSKVATTRGGSSRRYFPSLIWGSGCGARVGLFEWEYSGIMGFGIRVLGNLGVSIEEDEDEDIFLI